MRLTDVVDFGLPKTCFPNFEPAARSSHPACMGTLCQSSGLQCRYGLITACAPFPEAFVRLLEIFVSIGIRRHFQVFQQPPESWPPQFRLLRGQHAPIAWVTAKQVAISRVGVSLDFPRQFSLGSMPTYRQTERGTGLVSCCSQRPDQGLDNALYGGRQQYREKSGNRSYKHVCCQRNAQPDGHQRWRTTGA